MNGSVSIVRVVGLALIAVGFWFVGRYVNNMPAPRGLDAPPTEFSAARADATLANLLGPEVPHPVSTAANKAVRDRVRAAFAAVQPGQRLCVIRAQSGVVPVAALSVAARIVKQRLDLRDAPAVLAPMVPLVSAWPTWAAVRCGNRDMMRAATPAAMPLDVLVELICV